MNVRDPHSALKTEVITKANAEGLEVVLVRLQWGKDDVGFSLHVNPTQFSTSGLQSTDLLSYLGFTRHDQCGFTSFRRCYSKWVDDKFDIGAFVRAFKTAFDRLNVAQGHLEACGFALPQPEGWGFFHGKPSGRSQRAFAPYRGDGHTGQQISRMKQSEDDRFEFRFTFVDTGHDKAFVTHYRPKHLPASPEVLGAFRYLGLQEFSDCPEFDFEPCYYRGLPFVARGDGLFDGNVEFAHGSFDAHATRFSGGIENLLAANTAIESAGMSLLPLASPPDRMKREIASNVLRPLQKRAPMPSKNAIRSNTGTIPDAFDVAISFAGSERQYAAELAEILNAAGYAVFYDNFYPEHLWGKNLVVFFDEIFRKKARFCVMFVSEEYRDRKWTSHEARSAQARALDEKGNDYILPIRVDDTELDGLLPTLGFVPLSTGVQKIAELLMRRLAAT